jgi:cytochrome-b5 reductase
VTIHHVMIKSPDLQIERPYTPINDVVADGELKLVVKAVKGGEVGRYVHSALFLNPDGVQAGALAQSG